MSSTDAGVALNSMLSIVALLDTPAPEGGLPSSLNVGNIDSMLNVNFVDSGTSYNIRTAPSLIPAAIKNDAGRKILLDIARAN
jgi:hypothetical protein